MRSNTVTLLASLLLLAHNVYAFDIYLNKDEGCPDDAINKVCENHSVGECCEGDDNTEYYSAQASDGQRGITLQSTQNFNKCAVTIVSDNSCATSFTGGGTGASIVLPVAARGEEGGDEDPTNAEPAGEDSDGSGDHSRRHARSLSGDQEEAQAKKNKRTRIVGGVRHVQYSAHATMDSTHVYKLSRDSPLVSSFLNLPYPPFQTPLFYKKG